MAGGRLAKFRLAAAPATWHGPHTQKYIQKTTEGHRSNRNPAGVRTFEERVLPNDSLGPLALGVLAASGIAVGALLFCGRRKGKSLSRLASRGYL